MKKIPKASGFTLIEVILSIFVISVMFVMFQTAANTALSNRDVKDKELALRIASSEMESLRALAYDSLPSSGSFSNTLLSNLQGGVGTITVSAFNSKTKQVVTTVSWREPTSTVTSTVSLTTLITQGGL